MNAKQTNQELDANFAIIQKAWYPAVLDDSAGNVIMIAAYVAERHTGADGLVDLSPQHMSDAVNALTSVLKWKIAPKPQPLVQGLTKITNEVDHIIEANVEQAKENKRLGTAAAKAREQKEIESTLREAEHLSKTAHRQTTSKALALREDLDVMLRAGIKKGITLTEARALLQKMKAHADSNEHTPRGFLPTGWN